ncbi:FxsA family protein [Chloroflexota bacterium]
MIGVTAFAGSMRGWLLGKANWLERFLLLAGGFLLIFPGIYTDLIGVGVLVVASLRSVRNLLSKPKLASD